MKRKTIVLLAAAIPAILGFIFLNSVLDNTASGRVSRQVGLVLRPILNPFLAIPNGIFQKIIRKMAHFIEFFVLGGALALGTKKLKWRGKWIVAVTLAVLAACSDEIIQIFSADRTTSILDVIIDVAGALCGMAAAVHIKLFRKNRGK